MKDIDNKRKIMQYFRSRGLEYVSGEALSKALGFSRANVWKYIKKLREDGYVFDAVPRQGYKFKSAPNRVLEHELAAELDTKIFGKQVVHSFEEITSTNDKAYQLAEEGAPEGTIIIAQGQTKGKGRIGRKWVSPNGGGIYVSLILRPDAETDEIPSIALIAALAVAKAIKEETGLEAGVKWPNDVLINGKKVCGILTEIKAQPDRVDFLVVGIGVNVGTPASKLPPEGTSLAAETSAVKAPDMTVFLRRVLEAFERAYIKFGKEGFNSLRKECKELSLVIGKQVNVVEHHRTLTGKAVDIDEKGALIVLTEDGDLRRVFSGDVVLCRAQSA